MNFVYMIIIFLSNIKTGKLPINIKKTKLLENDLWPFDKEQTKIYQKGYLYKISVIYKCVSFVDIGFDYYQRDCYSLGITEKGYIILNSQLLKDTGFSEELNNRGIFFLKFLFLFTDNQIKNQHHFGEYKGKKQFYESYKWLEKSSEDYNVVSLKRDVTKTFILHIKERFKRFVCMRLLNFNEYISKISSNNFLSDFDDKKPSLYHFKDFCECVESLKKFISSIKHFQLIEKISLNSSIKKSFRKSINTSTTVKTSHFMDFLNKKFEKDYKKPHSDPNKNKLRTFFSNFADMFRKRNRVADIDGPYQSLSLLFNKFCDHLKNEILSNNFLFTIGGKYDMNFYLETFYNHINELIEHNLDKFEVETEIERTNIFKNMIKTFQCNLDSLQKTIIDELCEEEYVHKYFPKLFKREIKTFEDYIDVEKIVCDYYNMLVYIFSLDSSFASPHIPSCYYPPIFFDDYDFKIIDGIEIELEEQVEHITIKVFDDNEKEFILVKDVHYFTVDACRFYLTSDFLKSMNVETIQIISNDLKIEEKFDVKKYLKI